MRIFLNACYIFSIWNQNSNCHYRAKKQQQQQKQQQKKKTKKNKKTNKQVIQ